MAEETASWPRAPMPWQLEAWNRTEALVQSDSLPHATLLAGPEDIGKRHFQLAMAARLLCQQPTASTACGECRSCQLLESGSNPDLLMVEPEEDSRVIKIDQIRRLIDFAAKTPALADRKIILVGPAEVMNINAANALLKCLEEPSASTIILLYSHQPSALPATVRSRCQTQAMSPPPQDVSVQWLQQFAGDATSSRQLLELAGGRPLAARKIFLEGRGDQVLALQKALDALLEGKISALEFPQAMAELDLAEVLALMQLRLEHSLKLAVLDGEGFANRDGFRLRDDLARLRRSVSNGANPNRQLAIEDCASQLVQAVGQGAA